MFKIAQSLTLHSKADSIQCLRSFLTLSRGSSASYDVVRRHGRQYSTHAEKTEKIRNIGIIAHIDAGKTTTTERMLYYSGFTRSIGDVDDGSTVTDFLPMEKARGITIQSAAITFYWPPEASGQSDSHTINLIDTPGHADFTFEVLRSLRVLDGAVCILDGVAGVEAQTEQVWKQANVYQIPRIIFVNKLDRMGATFGRTVRQVGEKLDAYPAVCQIPWYEGRESDFVGVADIFHMKALRWNQSGDGKNVQVFGLSEVEKLESELASEMKRARVALVELLSEHDDGIIEVFEEHDDFLQIPAEEILRSLRRCLIAGQQRVIPVFAGASFRNIGVQPLLDAVVSLLPGPEERPDPEIEVQSQRLGLSTFLKSDIKLAQLHGASKQRQPAKNNPQTSIKNVEACALAFKVVNDAQKGMLVYLRVYSGTIERASLLFNTNLHVSERPLRLMRMYASDAVEIPSVSAGQIAVVAGLKHARTGDTLISYRGATVKSGPPAPLNGMQLRPIEVPPPVFFASIEPQTLSEEKHLSECLAMLLREDPSLHISIDEDSGQTMISGMGELHLEIAKDRLVNTYKAKAEMGSIEIGYRECVDHESGVSHFLFDRDVAGRKGKAGCAATVAPWDGDADSLQSNKSDIEVVRDGNLITLEGLAGIDSMSDPDLPSGLTPDIAAYVKESLLNGAAAALARSPNFAYPVHSSYVKLRIDPATDLFGKDSTSMAISSAARLATQAALRSVKASEGLALMEPVMNVTITVDEASLGAVTNDISSARGGSVMALDEGDSPTDFVTSGHEGDNFRVDPAKIYAPPDPFESQTSSRTTSTDLSRPHRIVARVPLKEMVGYLNHLRSLTGGRGTFVMSVDRFEKMSKQRAKAILNR